MKRFTNGRNKTSLAKRTEVFRKPPGCGGVPAVWTVKKGVSAWIGDSAALLEAMKLAAVF